VGGEHRFRFPGNWKIQLENTTDAYHFPLVHKSFLSSVDKQTEEMLDFVEGPGFVEDLGNGHSVMVMIPDLVDLEANLDAPIPERFAALAEELRADYPEDQVRRIVRAVGGSGFNLNIFPNIACSMAFFRVLRPVSVTETEIHHAVITMDGGPAAANRARLRMHEHFQGPMGFGTPTTRKPGSACRRAPAPAPTSGSCSTAASPGTGDRRRPPQRRECRNRHACRLPPMEKTDDRLRRRTKP
jgi:phenylpropionate dioxygenase-like ring-hydroxylating dioxygenase large terminal subunit